jgi:hypothetical protein
VDPAEAARGVPGRAGRTDILGALEAIGSGAGGSTRRLAGALVVSDGADNAALAEGAGPEARAKVRALGVPVNAIAVGRSAPKDLAVERVAVDEFAFVRNTVTIEVALRARGFSDEEVRLVLRREGAVVASATVRLERGRDRYTVPLSFAPDETGTFVFTVAAPVPGRGRRREQRALSSCASSATASACSWSWAGAGRSLPRAPQAIRTSTS